MTRAVQIRKGGTSIRFRQEFRELEELLFEDSFWGRRVLLGEYGGGSRRLDSEIYQKPKRRRPGHAYGLSFGLTQGVGSRLRQIKNGKIAW